MVKRQILSGFLVAMMTSSANAAAHTSGKNLALVFKAIDRYDAALSITVNGLPIGAEIGRWIYPKSAEPPYLLIPEVLLHTGKNWIGIQYAEVNPGKPHALELRLVELESLASEKVRGEIMRLAPDTTNMGKSPLSERFDFEVTGDIPAWSFASAPVIADSPAMSKKLMAAAKALAVLWNQKPARPLSFPDQALAAQRAGLDEDPELARVSRWLRNPALVVEVRTDLAEMQVFDGGHLARLTWGARMPWRLLGGFHDAPAGQMGPVDLELDVWFCLDAQGRFVPVAVWQIGVGPENL